MRSRYSAYCQQDMAYLRKSWHPSTIPASLSPDPTIQWLSLTVLNTQDGQAEQTKGEVEFMARFILNGSPETLHERSKFVQEKGQWFYLNGLTELPAQQKISRNAPCPCGSGKKYKKCCLSAS
jgi:SEC-C motif-containing protein